MTPPTYGRDFAYCLKSHGGVRGFNASLWRFLLLCTLFCHSVATFLTTVSSYEGGCGFEDKKNKLGAITDDIATRVDNIGRSSGGGHDNLTLAIIETQINSKLKPKMSKRAKITIIGLITLLVISVALNISQFASTGSNSDTVMQDSIASLCKKDSVKSDSIKLLQDSINGLNGKISKIKQH